MRARARTAALLEVLGVYLAGRVVVTLLTRLLPVHLVNPLPGLTVRASDAELITAAWQLLVLLTLQYAGWFLLIVPINWWHRRRGAAAYGVTRAGHTWAALLLAGLATVALAAWPSVSIQLADTFYDLGETVPWRQALFDMSWRRWEFWLLMAVLSFAFVAVVEELFFRGYCQRRLAEAWGDGPAIVGIACLFTFAHSQYLVPNAYNVGMLASALVMTIGFGVVFAWTRSLLPSIIAHSLVNIPMTPLWQAVFLVGLLVGATVMVRRGAAIAKRTFSPTRMVACITLALIGSAYAVAAPRVEHLELSAAAMVALAVWLETIDRRYRGDASTAATV